MNSDEILAELDAQYQELIQSVQLEGLSQDENSEKSELHNTSLQNVNQIIKKYEQTLQTSREFYEKEIKKLEDTKKKTESKYIESKKRIKQYENRIVKISENHQLQISTLTEQKDTEIKKLNEKLKTLTQQHTKVTTEHAKCSETMLINQQCLEQMQQENAEIKTKNKTNIEKYKLEIVQTRNCFDEQQKECQDLQKQLKECRNEIHFLCTTNEDLCNINENLTKKLQKYSRANSLINSVILQDDKSEIHQMNTEIKDEKKQTVANDQNTSADLSTSISIFNLDDNNLDSCKLLTTTSSMYMMENEDNKIKQEIQRISYEFICKEKNELLQKINKYEQKIQNLQNELLTQQKIFSNEKREGPMSEFPSEKKIELENISAKNQQLKQKNASKQNEIKRLKAELKQLNTNNNEIKEENNKMKQDMNTQHKLRQIINESELSRKRLNDRHDTLSAQYMSLQTQFHETKLEYNEILSKEKQYKQDLHKLSVNIKFRMKELEQSKKEQINLRQNNTKQTEEISQLNHDIKQMFADLENTRMQLMQSQQLITTLEKQLFSQTQQLQQKRQQLQVQMQINMQNLNVMDHLKNNIQNNDTNFNVIKKEIPETVSKAKNSVGKYRNSGNCKNEQLSSLTLQERQMSSLARGKPFLSQEGSINVGGNRRNISKKEQLSPLLKQKQKLETELFKLPTKPRSLEQRKKKHSLESKLSQIESQIESIKKSK